ncbi:hypothetical protein EYF80_015096 [Liparis tanakae]|uniref:Uncharacterized protein n=1 Tax=Liparis tanakae TaxID=230148 RepID=A0A4Z2I9Y0_9TELE|nr:hypothetical protein EYF80_015096 [Liparis tanakae]
MALLLLLLGEDPQSELCGAETRPARSISFIKACKVAGESSSFLIPLLPARSPHTALPVLTLVCVAVVYVGTLYLVRTDLNCSSVASVRTPVGSKTLPDSCPDFLLPAGKKKTIRSEPKPKLSGTPVETSEFPKIANLSD